MIVVTMTNCPPKLRGDLSKWLLEINTGVYVGQVSARVRDALWKRICENIRNGQATMVFSSNNEQHMDFYVHNTSWKPVDFDGITLMKHPSSVIYNNNSELKPGFSNISKHRMGKKHKKIKLETSYLLLDIETTGLSYDNDEIIEIGLIEVIDGNICRKLNWLIHNKKPVPDNIQKLTGINDKMLAEKGCELESVLKKLLSFIKNKTVLFYNASFDLKFLEENARRLDFEFPDINVKDIMVLVRGFVKGLDNYKLDTVASYFGIKGGQSHRAVEDCQLLYEVYNKLNEN